MKRIGGNTEATIQVSTVTRNAIGEQVQTWQDVQTVTGWLDLSSGSSNYASYNAKVQESTHLFVCDYVQLDSRIQAESAAAVINGKRYDIMLIDDPMGMNRQLEIYLKYTGGL